MRQPRSAAPARARRSAGSIRPCRRRKTTAMRDRDGCLSTPALPEAHETGGRGEEHRRHQDQAVPVEEQRPDPVPGRHADAEEVLRLLRSERVVGVPVREPPGRAEGDPVVGAEHDRGRDGAHDRPAGGRAAAADRRVDEQDHGRQPGWVLEQHADPGEQADPEPVARPACSRPEHVGREQREARPECDRRRSARATPPSSRHRRRPPSPPRCRRRALRPPCRAARRGSGTALRRPRSGCPRASRCAARPLCAGRRASRSHRRHARPRPPGTASSATPGALSEYQCPSAKARSIVSFQYGSMLTLPRSTICSVIASRLVSCAVTTLTSGSVPRAISSSTSHSRG